MPGSNGIYNTKYFLKTFRTESLEMESNYKHIIWDWNGTLINDTELCHTIINELLRKRGIREISLQKYLDEFGFPVVNFYTGIGFDFSKEQFHVPASEYIDAYNSRRFNCSLHEGALGAVSCFHEAGVEQSILSASKQSSLDEAVRHYLLTPYFSYVYGISDHYANGKAEIAINLIKNISREKKEILLIGDTEHDYEVAQLLGIDCILVCNGHQSRDKLKKCGALVLESIADIKDAAAVTA